MRAWAMLILVAPMLAGCASDDGEPVQDGPEPTIAAMDFDVKAAIDWWEHISTEYPKHDSFTPMNDIVRDHLIAELEAIGLDVEVRSYPGLPRALGLGTTPPEGTPMTPATEIDAIIATKAGTGNASHRIGLVSHYDTQTATVHGAYDDKSGVAAQFHICKALMEVELNKTLACIFFDAEEQGLVASQRYVEDIQDEDYVYDFVIGYDMTGINWPGHDWKMYVMTGDADYVPLLMPVAQQVMHVDLGYPTDGVEVLDTHDRNSDERRFKDAGIPIYRFAGGRHAADYPQYHKPDDTVEYVYDYVGGRANFEAGFSTIVEGSFHLYLALDQTDIGALGRLHGVDL